MTRLIIHVGPGKCGSSSIQDFFSAQNKPCVEKTAYSLLSAVEIHKLDNQIDDPKAAGYFQKILSKHLVNGNCLILSQEYLFQTPSVVNKICQLAEGLTDDISVIGYCRQQSNFLTSQYSQWLFRAVNRVGEVNKYINHLGLDWRLFTGVERQFIASIYNDFQSARMLGGYSALDWNESYQKLENHILDKSINISCGVLPSKTSEKTLIEDFCEKAKLTLLPEAKSMQSQISNPSFSSDIVEAINNAILHDHEMPGPHAKNSLIEALSSNIRKDNIKSDFMDELKAYIDGYYWQSNKLHCKRYKLDQNYFANPQEINKSQIMEAIKKEGKRREKNTIETVDNYRKLNAKLMKLCIKLSEK